MLNETRYTATIETWDGKSVMISGTSSEIRKAREWHAKLKAMSSEEREKTLEEFDRKNLEALRKRHKEEFGD